MQSVILVVPDTVPVSKAAKLLARSGMSAAPVVDEEGRLVGVVSLGDLGPFNGSGHGRTSAQSARRRPGSSSAAVLLGYARGAADPGRMTVWSGHEEQCGVDSLPTVGSATPVGSRPPTTAGDPGT
jgi:hypothetical protein